MVENNEPMETQILEDDASVTQQKANNTSEKPMESMADYERELNASFKTINEGDIISGTVIGISDTEVTVDLGYYAEGIIRLEDYSEDPSFSIKNDVTIGGEIKATVLRSDDGQGNILLSKKEANAILAWEALEQYKKDQTNLTVKITGVVNAGVIAYVEGIRGFIPASKLSLEYVENTEEWLFKTIMVRVITVDAKEKKLILSSREILKEQVEANRKTQVSNVDIGLVTEGTVESLQPYGAFIDLGNGLSGLVHISQICHKRIKHPGSEVSVGDTVKVKVIDIKDGKLSLSMKALDDVATEEIVEEAIELPETEGITTSLGSLFANIKLN